MRVRRKIEKTTSDMLLCAENIERFDQKTVSVISEMADEILQRVGGQAGPGVTGDKVQEAASDAEPRPGYADDGEPEF